MIIRLTKKLAKKIHSLDAMNNLLPAKNPYLDWSANLFRSEQVQYIIITNTVSLYSMIMPGRGITDHKNFIDGVMIAMRDFLIVDDNEAIYSLFIEPNISPMMFAKSLNRSVTGSMRELIFEAQFLFRYKDLSLWDISRRMNETPMTLIQNLSPFKVFKFMEFDQDSEM
ncbi:DUF6933 domain-containing protein [Candidatus Latescibacterota bacterium]